MSFHPKMAYGATFHKSSRTLTEPGAPFTYTPENRIRFDAQRMQLNSGEIATAKRPRSTPAVCLSF